MYLERIVELVDHTSESKEMFDPRQEPAERLMIVARYHGHTLSFIA